MSKSSVDRCRVEVKGASSHYQNCAAFVIDDVGVNGLTTDGAGNFRSRRRKKPLLHQSTGKPRATTNSFLNHPPGLRAMYARSCRAHSPHHSHPYPPTPRNSPPAFCDSTCTPAILSSCNRTTILLVQHRINRPSFQIFLQYPRCPHLATLIPSLSRLESTDHSKFFSVTSP